MKKLTVTAIDTIGIQSYIFGSNALKHNVGASELVRCATQDWVYRKLGCLGPTNVDQDGHIDGQTMIERDNLVSELIYAGGGNTVLLFDSFGNAQDFARCLTLYALNNAPGLQLVIAHTKEFDWENEVLSKAVKATLEKANRKKRDRVLSAPLLGLGVTADCQYTGLPAIRLSENDGRRISAEISAKEKAFKAAHDRLTSKIPLNGYEIPKIFDEFGRTKGESSYIAVIHTDGNDMSKRIANIAGRYNRQEDNRPYINEIRNFSESIKGVTQDALNATYKHIINSIDDGKIGGVVQINKGKIPFRPIVMGGDDVTFVCDGRLALTLTEFYLRQIITKPLPDNEKPLSLRAGISVVKSHFPFARAYALSEELAESAKRYLNELKAPPFNVQDLSAIDWHFAVSGPVLDLEQIRKREYANNKLTMRPLHLGSCEIDWRSWDIFLQIVNHFRTREEWTERRNKVKELQQALRGGKDMVKQFLHIYDHLSLPDVPMYQESAETGWIGDRCSCFDAIEALEFFVPLEVKK